MGIPLTEPRPRPPDNTARLVFTGQQSSMNWAIILWLNITSSQPSGADLSSLLTTISNSWLSTMAPLYVATCSLTSIQAVWILPGGSEIVISNTTARVGTHAGTQLPNLATCSVANWRVDKYYRGGKPRSYLPGVPITSSTDFVHLTTAAITETQAGWAGLMGAINSATTGEISKVELGTVSFVEKKQWRDTPVFWKYNGVTIRSVLGTQRRRLLT